MVVEHPIILLVGLVVLLKGAETFVEASSRIARLMGVSEFTIGLTLVAVGTSIPEMAASLFASYQGRGGIVTGTNVGANMANLGMLIGIAALIKPFKTDREMLEKDGYIMLFSGLVFYAFIWGGTIVFWEGLVLTLLYLVYVLFLFSEKPKHRGKYGFRGFIDYFMRMDYVGEMAGAVKNNKRFRDNMKGDIKKEVVKNSVLVVLSGVAIVIGAHYVVRESIWAAEYFNVPGNVIGLTVLALGTSLPELSVTVSAAKKGMGNLLVGNIMGSYIARMFLIIGLSSIIRPLEVVRSTITLTGPFMIVISIMLLFFLRHKWEVTRAEGVVLLLSYIGFMAWFLTGS